MSLGVEGPRNSPYLADDETTHQASHNAYLKPVHELMNEANQELSNMLKSLDSHNFEQPINEHKHALEQVKTQFKGEVE